VDTGSRQENASKQKWELGLDSIKAEIALVIPDHPLG
jgi:hypothetical protein